MSIPGGGFIGDEVIFHVPVRINSLSPENGPRWGNAGANCNSIHGGRGIRAGGEGGEGRDASVI